MSSATVDTAICLCNKGTMPSALVTISVPTVQIGDKRIAATTDTNMMRPFGKCKITKVACTYMPAGIWGPLSGTVSFSSNPPLVEGATLGCVIGGKIKLIIAMQDSVDIGGCKPPPEPKWYEKIIATMTMEGVANAPGLDDCIIPSPSDLSAAIDFALTIAPLGKGLQAFKLLRLAKLRRVPFSAAARARILRPATRFTKHGIDRALEHNIKLRNIRDAVKNPLSVGPVKYDYRGLPSQRFTGKKATVAINPDNKRIVSVNPTSSKLLRRLSRDP